MANQGKRMVSEDQIKKLEGLADIREAGDGITITNGVISAAGGSVGLYRHNIRLKKNGNDNQVVITIYNTSSSAFTFYDVCKYIYDNGFRSSSNYIMCSGTATSWDTYGYVLIGCYIVDDPATVSSYQLQAYGMSINLDSSITDHFTSNFIAIGNATNLPSITDTVTQIL